MKIVAKILRRVFANKIQQYIKSIIHHNHVGFITEIQSCFNIQKRSNVIPGKKNKCNNHMIVSTDLAKIKLTEGFFKLLAK